MDRLLIGLVAVLCLSGTGHAAPPHPAVSPQVPTVRKIPSLWSASTFKAVNGSYSAWCGSYDVVSCAPSDQDGGYGGRYNETLEWRGTVANPALSCTVSVAARINIDTMWSYDYFFISCSTATDSRLDLLFLDGLATDLPVAAQIVYGPGEYLGPGGDQVVIRFRVTSDSGWDGADCLWPNDGAVQLDDVVITLSNGAGYSHDFEDGTLGAFVILDNPAGVPAAAGFAVTAYPNPLNPMTTISYRIGRPGHLTLGIYDLQGRRVRLLHNGPVASGGTLTWDGRDAGSTEAPSGIYFFRADLDGELQVGKLALVR